MSSQIFFINSSVEAGDVGTVDLLDADFWSFWSMGLATAMTHVCLLLSTV
jgi:hypothetical protein